MKKTLLLIALALLTQLPVAAQNSLGVPPFGSFSGGGLDTINNQNLNVYFTIPIVSSPGRGMPLNLSLNYNSLIYVPYNNGTTTSWTPVVDANGNPTWGWVKDFAGGQATYHSTTVTIRCFPSDGSPSFITTHTTYQGFNYVDVMGTKHYFPSISYTDDSNCSGNVIGTTAAYSSDSSGYYMDGSVAMSGQTPVVTSPGGVKNPGGTVTDANGNYVTKTIVSSTETDWKDSVGNTALKIIYSPSQTSPTSIQYQFLDGSGNYQTTTLKLSAVSIKTIFGCSSVPTEYTGTAYLPYELDIPSPVSGTLVYKFSYEPTPGNSGYYTGRLLKVTLPTLGTYEYDYPTNVSPYGMVCADGSTLSVNRTISDGTNLATWNYVRNTSTLTTTLTTPALADTTNANDTVYTFSSTGLETSRKIYANSPGTSLLRTINTTWAANNTPATSTTILEDNSTKAEVDTTYDSNGLLGSLTEYDCGTGAHGSSSPLRTTTYSYQTSTNYTIRNIINLVTSKIIKDGTGATQYRQDITYDGVALSSCPPGQPQHDDTNYSCTMNYRGNPTAVTTYLTPATPANGIAKNFTYDFFGNLLTAQLNCCEQKTWTYSSGTKYAQPDSVTSGSSQTLTTNYTYTPYLGLVATAKDQNGLETDYTYDYLRRPTKVAQKNGSTTGETINYGYDDVNFKTTVTTTLDSTNSVQQIAASDKFGHTSTTTLEDANNSVKSIVQTLYDLAGRGYSTSNPYTTSPAYYTTTAFDVLGRPSSVTLPGGSAKTTYTYTANTITVKDPAGKQRRSVLDAAGRLSSVFEPDGSGNLTVQTLYTYTVLDKLASTADAPSSPAQSRNYTDDALGRLLSSVTPEGGTTCFGTKGTSCNTDGYDNFDNLKYRTDARGVVTSYGYDGLNRLKQVSYNVGTTGVPATSTISLAYGLDSSCVSAHGAGCIGHLITMTDGPGSENYTYNSLEQMTQLQKTIGTTTYNTQYAYNLAGELTQITYPSGRVVLQNLDAIGRLCSVGASGSICTAGTTYASGFSYNTAQQLTGFNYGNGIAATFGYSADRLQLTSLSYAKSGTTLFGLTYSYGAAGSNNGQIAGITDSVDNGRSVAYTYDPLARLSTALTTGSANYPQWGLSWGYDRYGNRRNQTLTAGSGYQGSVNVAAATNHITSPGYAYDANGNMTNDSTNTLVYDAENHAVSATNSSTSGTYSYDGKGLRVKKASGSTTTVYVFSGSKVIAEYDNGAAVGSPSREYVYGGSSLLAKIDSSGTKYYHQDHLSNRVGTDSTGATVEQMGHYPYGDPWYNATNDKLYFTTYERDSESGNDYAMARYYVWRIARFLSLDPLSGSTGDPQSLNRYSYVRNSPTYLTDPKGTCPTGGSYDLADGGGRIHSICTGAPARAGSDGVDFVVDGIETPDFMNGLIEQMLSIDAMFAQCKDNTCSGWTEDGQHATYIAEAGAGFRGTLLDSDIAAGFVYIDGVLVSSSSYQDYIRITRARQIAAQQQAAQSQAADMGIPEGIDTSMSVDPGYLQGGNYNFTISKNFFEWADKECGNDRCNNGLHFETNGTGQYFLHLDGANPQSGFLGLSVHFGRDIVGGNLFYFVLPPPHP
jgi:RHS repeat-associated protein